MANYYSPNLVHGLVWPHGVEKVMQMFELIEAHGGFSIRHVYLQRNPNLRKLISIVYRHDYAPISHLSAKLRYLRKLSGDCIHFFLQVEEAQFFLEGEGSWRHYESASVNDLKWKLRREFNPRGSDGNMTHHHVVHFSDNPEQARDVANATGIALGDDRRGLFERATLGVRTPSHIRVPPSLRASAVSVRKLRALVWSGSRKTLMPVDDTPHMKALTTRSKEIYDSYLLPRLGGHLRDGHSYERLTSLLATADGPGFSGFDPIIVIPLEDGFYQILDGVHRASVAHHLNWEEINAAVFIE